MLKELVHAKPKNAWVMSKTFARPQIPYNFLAKKMVITYFPRRDERLS
jgi:hypothetical protein